MHYFFSILILFSSGVLASENPENSQSKLVRERAKGEVVFLPRLTALKIDATDVENASKGTFTSSLNPGFELGWQLNAEKVKLLIFADLKYQQINAPSNRYIVDRSQTLVGGGVGVGFHPLSDKRFELMLLHTYRSHVFIRATDATNLVLDKMTVPDFEARVSFYPIRTEKWRLGADLTGFAAFSFSSFAQDFRNGFGGTGKILAQYDYDSSLQIMFGPVVGYGKMRTRIVEQVQFELGAITGLVWTLD